MCTKQCAELSAKDKTIEDQRRQIQDQKDVIQKLLDANKKLEVALGAMTTAANNALEAKKKIREDLKLLRTSHLRDIINRNNEKNVIRQE
jgi:predicted nucleotide-binding protein (sugar kinase/HSP70/actin superfamily)